MSRKVELDVRPVTVLVECSTCLGDLEILEVNAIRPGMEQRITVVPCGCRPDASPTRR